MLESLLCERRLFLLVRAFHYAKGPHPLACFLLSFVLFQRHALFIVRGVRALRDPPYYTLANIEGKELPGSYPHSTLKKVTRLPPFIIDTIVAKSGQKWLVTFKFYPRTIKKWVNVKDVIDNEK